MIFEFRSSNSAYRVMVSLERKLKIFKIAPKRVLPTLQWFIIFNYLPSD